MEYAIVSTESDVVLTMECPKDMPYEVWQQYLHEMLDDLCDRVTAYFEESESSK